MFLFFCFVQVEFYLLAIQQTFIFNFYIKTALNVSTAFYLSIGRIILLVNMLSVHFLAKKGTGDWQ